MTCYAQSFIEFVKNSPTVFHAVETVRRRLTAAGYAELRECDEWSLKAGGKYYVTRNRSSIIAFALPESGFGHFQIASSHGDSPTFRLKPVTENEVCGKYIRLNTERYGGAILSSWLDRPLSVAGRLLVKEGNKITTRLVDLKRDAVLIPNVAGHLNRQINEGYVYNPQTDMLPLFGDITAKGELLKQLAEAAGVEANAVIGSDLFLYNRVEGRVWGAHNEFLSCGRIDDLGCAYTSMEAMAASEAKGHINMLAVFDTEEVGSASKQGANSDFLRDTIQRIGSAMGATDAQICAAMASGFMISGDNAHAVHPNQPQLHDPDNRAYMNEGVVMKYHANQKYTTDGASTAVFREICARANVPLQVFANRSDMPNGSTLGNHSNKHVSMNTIDIGIPQLSMHSAYETAGVRDLGYMIDALKQFYATDIRMTEDGTFELEERA